MNVPLTHAIPLAVALMCPSPVAMMMCVPSILVYLALDVRTPRSVATITMPALMIIANLLQDVPMSLLLLQIVTMVTHVPLITAIPVSAVIIHNLGVNAMIIMHARMIVVILYLVA